MKASPFLRCCVPLVVALSLSACAGGGGARKPYDTQGKTAAPGDRCEAARQRDEIAVGCPVEGDTANRTGRGSRTPLPSLPPAPSLPAPLPGGGILR